MNVIRNPGPWNPGGRKVCAAIGVFDGVHLGHQAILRQTIETARSCDGIAAIVTFDRHPNEVVAPDRAPLLLYPLSKKLKVLETLGTEAVRLIHFDKAFSQMSAEEFARELASDAGRLSSVCVGEAFTFGRGRRGNTTLLRELGGKLGFTVEAAPDVKLDGAAISSTRARQAAAAGDFALAERLLGRAYSLCATVVSGAQLGRKLGFPTANLAVAGLVTPPAGVYVAEAEVGGSRVRAAVNIGCRPTIDPNSKTLVVEAHLLDFDGDIYGQELELIFLRKLRDERKFPSVSALREQVELDVAEAREL